jgi:glycogen(starch) synthase
MKILLASHYFHPAVGGLETVARILAEQFIARGHEVRVITTSLARSRQDDAGFPYRIYRRPNVFRLTELVHWCDIFFQNNISLRTLWPLLIVQRPWVFSHQTWLTRVDGTTGWQDRLKLFLVRFASVSPISISRAVAVPLPVRATLIGNPYRSELFRVLPDVPRDRDIVFLARLVSDKGGDLTLEALSLLKHTGLTPSLTIVGGGPELENLKRQARELGVQDQVTFAGVLTEEPLVRMLNRHRIMAVPSRLAEPFGVVALEGIACGCALVGSERGGLTDAIGPCGLTFPNNDAPALAEALRLLLTDEPLCQRLRAEAPAHLAKHSAERIADAYLEVFESALALPK